MERGEGKVGTDANKKTINALTLSPTYPGLSQDVIRKIFHKLPRIIY